MVILPFSLLSTSGWHAAGELIPAIQLARCLDYAGKGSRDRVVMKLFAENPLDVRQVQIRELVVNL